MGWFMQIKLTPPLFSLAPPHPAPSLEFSGTHPFRWHSHHDIPRKSLNKALLARGWRGGLLRSSSFSRRGGQASSRTAGPRVWRAAPLVSLQSRIQRT